MPRAKIENESVIKAHCFQYLVSCREFFGWVTTNTGIWEEKRKIFRRRKGIGMRNGVADVAGIWSGKGLQIEIKTRYGTVSDAQKSFLADFTKAGGIACVLRSVEDCADLVSSLRWEKPLPQKLTKDFI